MSIEEFIHNLQQYNHPNVFNPWRDYDPECDIGPVCRSNRHELFIRH
jgi:hypothetical protein